eukprot:6460184-Amphidinium_carterae.1
MSIWHFKANLCLQRGQTIKEHYRLIYSESALILAHLLHYGYHLQRLRSSTSRTSASFRVVLCEIQVQLDKLRDGMHLLLFLASLPPTALCML